MQCPSCFNEVADGAKFCPQCATRLPSRDGVAADPLRTALQATVGTRYEVMRLLGRGAMGAVYLARERALERDVAIKVLPPERTSETDRERFRREARIAARLTHPNIVPLHAFGEADGTMYFVMGCVRGEPLSARMKRGLTVDAARKILLDLADALDHAHRQGVVHRDIKPDNVLIDDDSGRPMLTDFGIAKAPGPMTTGLTATGSVVGTPHYMSPEQAAGKTELDGRSDLYSLGAMGYAMLANRVPFDGPSVGDVLIQHITKDPPPLKSVAPTVPDALAAVIGRCLAKDPGDRWPDGKSLREALAAAGEGDEIPEGLQGIDGFGLTILAVGLVVAAVNYVSWLFASWLPGGAHEGYRFSDVLVLPLCAILLGALFLLRQAIPARRAGFGWRSIAWAAFVEPRWWRWWYPRGMRRPEDHDVWDRLPARIRRHRALRLAFPLVFVTGLLVAVTAISPRIHLFTDFPWFHSIFWWPPVVNGVRPIPPLGALVAGMGWIPVGLIVLVHLVVSDRWLSRLGLSEADRSRVLGAPLAQRSFWRKPSIAAVLQAMGEPGVSVPTSPAELAQAIDVNAKSLSGPESEIAREAASAARHLVVSIDAMDREIQRLAHDVDPQEKARLHARLDGLGSAVADEPEDRGKMRSLFAQQMQLVSELEARLAEASDRRARRIELLKALWLEVANLRAEVARNVPGRGQTSGRVKALCTRIAAARQPAAKIIDRDGGEDMPTLG